MSESIETDNFSPCFKKSFGKYYIFGDVVREVSDNPNQRCYQFQKEFGDSMYDMVFLKILADVVKENINNILGPQQEWKEISFRLSLSRSLGESNLESRVRSIVGSSSSQSTLETQDFIDARMNGLKTTKKVFIEDMVEGYNLYRKAEEFLFDAA